MHTYVSRLKDTELETLIATYDIPLDLRPRLPDPNFRMINLSAGDTAIGIYSRIFDSSGVRIPFSSSLLVVLKYFKVHISQLVPLGLSKVITFEVLCRSLNIEPTVTLFRVFQTLSKQGDWFSFAKCGDPAPVCMEVAKSGLKLWKEKFFLIDRRAIPFHMPWRHPDSCITDKVPTNFNQSHVGQLKAHIVKLRDISDGVLVRSGLSRAWRNPMCDPVLRRSDNTVMSIYDFLCMPSLDKATVREEPHGLDTSILGRVADHTTSPALAGTAIPRASPEEIAVTRPDHKVATKADYAAKRKASSGPEISTNVAKKTRSSKKGSGAGSSGLAAGDEVKQTDDGTLDDDDQRDGSEFAMEDIGNLNDVSQGEHINVIPLQTFDPSLGLDVTYPPILLPYKEVGAYAELSGGVRRATRASFYVSHGVSEDASSGSILIKSILVYTCGFPTKFFNIALAEISRMTTLVPCEDRYVWTLESDGVFSVASIRKEIDGNRFQDVSLPTRWVKSVPIKVNIIAWKVKSNALPTRFNISRRGMDIDSIVCPICNAGVESTNHIFFQCVVVRQIMRKISSWWNIDYSDVNSYEEWQVWLVSIRIQSKLKGVLVGVYYDVKHRSSGTIGLRTLILFLFDLAPC
ncbi:RNA-directed DNA polymerase, eukaryota [Tanacetum coccineum]